MTDREIIQGLIERDNRVTENFFFVKCRPLFVNIIQRIFACEVDYDEFVNELYVYLMDNDAVKLRSFEYRCTVYQWLKVIAIRFFIKKRSKWIGTNSQETPYNEAVNSVAGEAESHAYGDIQTLLLSMPNKRYASVIKALIIEERKPEQVAKDMNITTANLYNIKRRAMAQLAKVALNDVKEYGK